MADITISLSDDRKLSIKAIDVSEFLEIWDNLMSSKVVSSLLKEKANPEFEELDLEHINGYTLGQYVRIEINKILENVINLYCPKDNPDARDFLQDCFLIGNGITENSVANTFFYKYAASIIDDDEVYDVAEAAPLAARVAAKYMLLISENPIRNILKEKQVTLSCDEKTESEALETFKKNRAVKIEADNEEISAKKLKGLVQEGLLAAGIFIEEDVKDGDLTAEINKMFDVDISPFSIVTLNEVTDKFMKGVKQLDATAAAYFAAKIAAMFVWERMKDNYIIGLKKGND